MSLKIGDILWEQSKQFKDESVMAKYMEWLQKKKGLTFDSYEELWEWSATEIEDFWESVWKYYEVTHSETYDTVLKNRDMPGATWFTGAKLNYTEHIFRHAKEDEVAIFYKSESTSLQEMTWGELKRKTAALATYLKKIGVQPGDRIVGYLPNIPETVIALYASASIGAIWSSCAPEFGKGSTLNRFQQIEPKVFIGTDGYQYNGEVYERLELISAIQKELPTVEQTIIVPNIHDTYDQNTLENSISWDDVMQEEGELTFEQVPFEHPLWIVFSSGTTGLPKSMVQGHGGILLNQFVTHSLQGNLKEGDRSFYYTTTTWIVWYNLVSSLVVGAKIILYDGSPGYPNISALWELVDETEANMFGISPPYLEQCMKAGIVPKESFNLQSLESISCTGSPLSPETFKWVYDYVKDDVWLSPISGGTDICGVIVGASPLVPVYLGEMSCRNLGISVHVYNEKGETVINEMGEMVITEPMPSMPLFFWNDPDGKKYEESYFDLYPGVWRHGDLLEITDRGSAIIYGRSDATINRGGIRAGSSEIYNAIEPIQEIIDSLVVDLSGLGKKSFMPLFVVLRENAQLTDALKETVIENIRREVSPRHVPDQIIAVPAIPRTLTNKKMEIPIRRILQGSAVEDVISVDTMLNPDSIQFFIQYAETLNS